MNTLLFIIATGFTTFLTFIFFRLFGVRGNNIFINSNDKSIWDKKLSGSLKKWLAITNTFGVITSLATLLFLAGSAKLFGIFSFATGITIAVSAYVTVPVTRKLLHDPDIKKRYNDNNQVGGVIASLFWKNTKYERTLASLVKYISILAMFSIIWLEISLFTNFASTYLHISSINGITAIAFVTFFIMFYFIIKYGLRGFVFADLFHSPIILLMGLCLISILGFMLYRGNYTLSIPTIITPQLTWSMATLFFFHVLVLNVFQIICTEPHWFRFWLFKNIELTSQKTSVVATGAVWILLLFIGFSTFAITGEIGEGAINTLLTKLSLTNPYFLFFFWIAASGALFSTVDTQLYSVLLVSAFKIKNGNLPVSAKRLSSSFLFSFLVSSLFAVVYYLVKRFEIPFEKILLIVVPFSTVLLPLFIAKFFDRRPTISALLCSVIGYILVAAVGFILPAMNFYFTLSSIFVPVVISLFVLFQKKIHNNF